MSNKMVNVPNFPLNVMNRNSQYRIFTQMLLFDVGVLCDDPCRRKYLNINSTALDFILYLQICIMNEKVLLYMEINYPSLHCIETIFLLEIWILRRKFAITDKYGMALFDKVFFETLVILRTFSYGIITLKDNVWDGSNCKNAECKMIPRRQLQLRWLRWL